MDQSHGSSQPSAPSRAAGFSSFNTAPSLWPESMSGQPGAPLRVHLVDSDPHARGVIARELMADARTVVAGQAGGLREGRRLVRDASYDVLLVDVLLGDGSGLDLVAEAKKLRPHSEAIVLSRTDSDEGAAKAFELGAAGFVTKNSWFINYVQAVLQVANGGAFLSPLLLRVLVGRMRPDAKQAAPAPDVLRMRLSTRELEVLRMIAGGLTSNEIGTRLTISCTTVNSHVKKVYEKLHVHSRAQAVSCANSWGLL
jgi:DNA-binding NarL/FixJ family response regulator